MPCGMSCQGVVLGARSMMAGCALADNCGCVLEGGRHMQVHWQPAQRSRLAEEGATSARGQTRPDPCLVVVGRLGALAGRQAGRPSRRGVSGVSPQRCQAHLRTSAKAYLLP